METIDMIQLVDNAIHSKGQRSISKSNLKEIHLKLCQTLSMEKEIEARCNANWKQPVPGYYVGIS